MQLTVKHECDCLQWVEEGAILPVPQNPPASRTLPALVTEMAQRCPEHPFLIEPGQTLTYQAFEEAVQSFARGLMALGIRRGDPVAILMGNRIEWIVADFAICSIGAVMVGLNTWATTNELQYFLKHSQARALITSGRYLKNDYLHMLEEIRESSIQDLAHLRHVIVTDEVADNGQYQRWSDIRQLANQTPVADFQAARDAVAPDDICYLLYTSGSTARPKGVLLQHAPMIENMWHIGQRQHVGPNDRLWLAVSLFWGLGCENALFNVMTHGASLVLQSHFDAAVAIRLINETGCTLFYGTPNMVTALIESEPYATLGFSEMRGGATIGSPEQIQRLVDAGLTDICNIYGLTETYGNCHVTDAAQPLEQRLRCVGQPLPGNQARICDPLTDAVLPTGEIGEIRIKGRVLLGYLNDLEATQKAFDPDGYFKTGDLGYEDETGHLHFKGRIKELIKAGGMNVSPVEVEEVIMAHPAIITAFCVGIPAQEADETAVAAVVVCKPGLTVDEANLRDWCATKLARYKRPTKYLFVADHEIPLTTTGKVKKNEIAHMFQH